MGERVNVWVDGPATWLNVYWQLRNAGLEVDDTATAANGGGLTFGVTLSDEAAKAPGVAGCSVPKEDRVVSGEFLGRLQLADDRAKSAEVKAHEWQRRAERAEAALAAQAKQPSASEETARAAAWERRASEHAKSEAFWRERAMKAETVVAESARRPSAGDRVRGLSLGDQELADLYAQARSFTEFGARVAHVIAAELDKQDAAQKPTDAATAAQELVDNAAYVRDLRAHVFERKRLGIDAEGRPLEEPELNDRVRAVGPLPPPAVPPASSLWAAAFAYALTTSQCEPSQAQRYADSAVASTKGHETEREKIASLIEAQLLEGWAEGAK